MHIWSIYTGLHHRNLEHRWCRFKSMHRPTVWFKKFFWTSATTTKLTCLLFEIVNAIETIFTGILSHLNVSLQCNKSP